MEVLALIVSISGIIITQQLRRQRQEQELLEIENIERTACMEDKRKVSHMNSKLPSLGRENNCITTCCFKSINDARKYCGRPKLSSRVICLNGQWKFKLFPNVSSGFDYIEHQTNENINTEQDITVPGCWQLQVLGDSPIYTNIKYIIPVDPPYIPEENPTGYYKHAFTLTSQQKQENNIYLSFGGIDSFFHLWINHQYIGYSSDSRLSADFNITSYLSCSHENTENLIELLVLRYSIGTYLEDQDMFNLSGIFRDVLVYLIPKHISIMDFNHNSSYNMNNRQGKLEISTIIKQKLYQNRFINQQSMNKYKKYAIQIVLYDEGILLHTSSHPHGNHSNNPLPSQFIFENSHINTPICSVIMPISSAKSVVDNCDNMKSKDLYLSDWQQQSKSHQQNDKLEDVRESRMNEEENNNSTSSGGSGSSTKNNIDRQHQQQQSQQVEEEEVMNDHISRIDCTLTIPASKCNLWCAEKPYIYTLVVSLLDVTDCTDADLEENCNGIIAVFIVMFLYYVCVYV